MASGQEAVLDQVSPASGDVATQDLSVALLTGGGDQPYAFGLSNALMSAGVGLDIIGNDELDCDAFHGRPNVNFLNLRGDQSSDAGIATKVRRLLRYYVRLSRYAATAKPPIFHILWNNRIEWLDRTLLMLYYKLLGKKVVLTAHNINAGTRDANDTAFNRMTLRAQYRLADHTFVHTEKMKHDLVEQIGINSSRITVIPFGINNAVPHTDLTARKAKHRLGIEADEKAILFFGNIAPYKGLEYLVSAFQQIALRHEHYRLIICGRAKDAKYWQTIEKAIRRDVENGRVLLRADFVPDEETEIYFKAADVVALPYTHIFQSGVLFLGYSFGLPVVASDVGSLREDIVEGETGFLCKPCDAEDLARALQAYFASPVYQQLEIRRSQIRDFAAETHSWDTVSRITCGVYRQLVAPAQSLPVGQTMASL